jgi:hypothetical protein
MKSGRIDGRHDSMAERRASHAPPRSHRATDSLADIERGRSMRSVDDIILRDIAAASGSGHRFVDFA